MPAPIVNVTTLRFLRDAKQVRMTLGRINPQKLTSVEREKLARYGKTCITGLRGLAHTLTLITERGHTTFRLERDMVTRELDKLTARLRDMGLLRGKVKAS